jgi:hypothetical protein
MNSRSKTYFFIGILGSDLFENASKEIMKKEGTALSILAKIDNNKKIEISTNDFLSRTKYMAVSIKKADKQSGEEHLTTSHIGAESIMSKLTDMAR